MKKINTVSKALAIGGVAIGLLGAGVGAYSLSNPKIITQEKIVEVQKLVPVEVVKEIETIKEVPVNVTVEKIVKELDEDKLKLFCDRLGFEDVTDCNDEIMAEQVAMDKALSFIEEDFDEIADMLEEEGIVKDEDETELVKVYDDFEDIDIKTSDYEDSKYKFEVALKVEDLDKEDKKKVLVTIEVEDGEVELKKVSNY